MTRRLDALVAQKVMGWTIYFADTGGPEREPLRGDVDRSYQDWSVPRFSTDIAAAWQVAEKMARQNRFQIETYQDEEGVMIWCVDIGEPGHEGLGDSPSALLAICEAALRFVGVDGDKIQAALEDGNHE